MNVVSVNEFGQVTFNFTEKAIKKTNHGTDSDIFFEIFSYSLVDSKYSVSMVPHELTSEEIIVNTTGHSSLYEGDGATIKVNINPSSAY